MDEAYLFDATVVANSRNWICVRLATYESEEEAAFLRSIFKGRSGALENTTFALLASDGKTLLSRTGRSPSFLMRQGRGSRRSEASEDSAEAFAKMLAKHGKVAAKKPSPRELPQCLDFRRALNVAACDNQPLVVLLAKKADRQAASKRLAKLCWSEDFVGKLQYAIVEDRKELSSLSKISHADGIFFVEPGKFGVDGKVLGRTSAKSSESSLRRFLEKSLSSFDRDVGDKRSRLRQGRREGIRWKSAIEVSDPGSKRRRTG